MPQMFLAKHPFQGDARQTQLSFPKGATINAKANQTGAWWWGAYNGKEGWFPPTYVQPMTQAQGLASPVTPQSSMSMQQRMQSASFAPSVKQQRQQQQQQQQQPKQEPPKRQYICTGYDMYTFYEPTIFEAMACLHSRLRRLIYFVPSSDSSSAAAASSMDASKTNCNPTITSAVWGLGISKQGVHHLQGTNHNYRAFEYRQSAYLS
mmetsp:Transcript_8043/g.23771  ORF Transcript_8043/g.23771 Transcript_8043/m.23771 type:complete len:207 (-) Transcript_8043:350-970(-)